jgi:carbon storage regulator
MLVLTRKYQEKIQIGDNITITVLKTKGKAVRLGIEAPIHVPVIRGELKFEDAADALAKTPSHSEETVAAAPVVAAGQRREVVADTAWTTKARPQGMSRNRSLRDVGEVGHGRVPRGQVGKIIPQLVSGNGALRELLDQRSTTL